MLRAKPSRGRASEPENRSHLSRQRSNLLKSTPLRLAASFALLFVAAYLLAGFATLQLFSSSLDARIERLISETMTVTVSAYGNSDLTDLKDIVDSYAIASPGKERVLAVVDADGKTLAGNISPSSLGGGWQTLAGGSIGADPKETYRLLTRIVGPVQVTVGMSYAETDALREIALTTFGWVSLLALILAIGGGLWLARRLQRRLDAITGVMHQVSRGSLGARIPVMGRGDDIDALTEQINEALARLAALVEGMRQVSSDIAHELRTPLGRLTISVEEVLEKAETGADVSASLADIQAECFRINDTFDALLRITQIESGTRKARFAPVSLAEIAEVIEEAYVDVAEERGQVFRAMRIAHPEPVVNGDRELLTQAVVNLVENSLRHCTAGAHISLAIGSTEAGSTIEIADDGPGIPEAEREHVFERLYRLEKSRTTEGSGLGLSLVRAVVELHGGTIELSDNAPGLKATIHLPHG